MSKIYYYAYSFSVSVINIQRKFLCIIDLGMYTGVQNSTFSI